MIDLSRKNFEEYYNDWGGDLAANTALITEWATPTIFQISLRRGVIGRPRGSAW